MAKETDPELHVPEVVDDSQEKFGNRWLVTVQQAIMGAIDFIVLPVPELVDDSTSEDPPGLPVPEVVDDTQVKIEHSNEPFVTPKPHFVDAVKLLGEWNRWLVTVQLAIIGAIGFIVKSDERGPCGGFFCGLDYSGNAAAHVAPVLCRRPSETQGQARFTYGSSGDQRR